MLSIIVLSSDGYDECWIPMFKSLKTYMPEVENYEILLSTNTKSFSYPGLNIKSLHNGNDHWSNRVKKTINQAKNDLVLILVEDFFLRKPLNGGDLKEIIHLMQTEEEIDHVRLLYYNTKFKTKASHHKNLAEITHNSNHRFLYAPGIWKKEVLQKYIVNFESPYMAEKMGNQRSYILKDGLFSISQEYVDEKGQLFDSGSSGAVYKGKWANWMVKFCQELKIDLDLNIRGFGDEAHNEMVRKKTLKHLIKTPITTLKSLLNIASLYINVNILRIRK